MLGLVLLLGIRAATIEVGGDGDCPSPAAVAAQLRLLRGGGDAHSVQRARLHVAAGALIIRLDEAGALVGERRLAATGSCAELAAAAAVVLATWEAELHPRPTARLPTGARSRSPASSHPPSSSTTRPAEPATVEPAPSPVPPAAAAAVPVPPAAAAAVPVPPAAAAAVPVPPAAAAAVPVPPAAAAAVPVPPVVAAAVPVPPPAAAEPATPPASAKKAAPTPSSPAPPHVGALALNGPPASANAPASSATPPTVALAAPAKARSSLGYDAGAAFVASLAGSAFAAGGALDVALGPRAGHWMARLSLTGESQRAIALSPGHVDWTRAAVGLGPRLRLRARAHWLFDIWAEGLAALLVANGSGFVRNQQSLNFDPGIGGGVRVSLRYGRFAPFVGVGVAGWLRQQQLSVTAANGSVSVPRFEALFSAGAAFGRF